MIFGARGCSASSNLEDNVFIVERVLYALHYNDMVQSAKFASMVQIRALDLVLLGFVPDSSQFLFWPEPSSVRRLIGFEMPKERQLSISLSLRSHQASWTLMKVALHSNVEKTRHYLLREI
jgi:hypothetical protein